MANTKPKKTSTKKTSAKAKTAPKTEKSVKAEAVAKETKVVETKKSKNPFKGFFAKKCDANENILTIFKSHKIWGAVLGEIIGTMLICMLMLTLGVYQPLYIMFGVLGITMAVYALSGAHINPLVTVGMMATRRVSAIRGVIYIIAQVVGAWIGLLIVNAFRIAGGEAMELPVMSEVAEGMFWVTTMIEFLGASIIGFFFARALSYKRSTFTFAAIVAAGTTFAFLIAIILSGNFVGLSNNFILNPAVAIMYQVLPSGADGFMELIKEIALALVTYVIFPMLGGVVGFYLADASSKLSGEETK